MKKTILLIIALITGIYSANAQYKKGDIELGGEISYKVTDGFHQFAISPEAEFFLNEHWAINTGISLFGNNHKTRFGISAGVNYYLPITQKLYFAPPCVTSFPSSMQLSITEERKGEGRRFM